MNLLLKLISSPWFWADVLLSVSGGLLVAWGLWLEKRAENHIPPTDFHPDIFGDVVKLQKIKEQRGWRILMTGIIVEVVAALGISVISGMEIADLSDQSAAANLEAKRAEIEAGQADERAAGTESNNLVLRLKLQPRSITAEQITNFIFLTQKITKIPITIHAASQGDDTMEFAFNLRHMFDKAGFPRGIVANEVDGVQTDLGNANLITYMYRSSGQGLGLEWPSVFFNMYGTNNFTTIDAFIPEESTNGFVRPIISDQNPQHIFEAIAICFNEIGIKMAWQPVSIWLSPGQYEIYVPPKIN